MEILYITSSPISNTSSANIGNIAIIRGLLALGNKVTILCAESPSLYNKELISSLGLDEAKIVPISYRTATIIAKDGENSKIKYTAKKVLRELFHSFSLFDHYKILVKKLFTLNIFNNYYDVMITASDPKSSHLIGKWIFKNHRNCYGKWIQLYGDPILIDITNKLKLPNSYIKHKEEKLIENADEVIYVSPLTLNKQREIFPRFGNKMHFIPIPYIKEKIYKKKPINYSELKVGYFGNYFTNVRNLGPLYSYISSNHNIHLHLYGNTDIPLKTTKNITVKSRVSLNEIEKVESEVDILIGVCNIKGTQIPAKLNYYAATNKPVIFIIDGDEQTKETLYSYLSKFNRYILCENNVNSIKNVFDNLKQYDNTNVFPANEFHYLNIAKEMSKLF
ncbi:hypothetical protein [Peribacillus sp. SCS-155]|uniref:hypothetical protein n=1 Tax=Peribacillus sedimenti TaxID=3115297 RepID=UPI00390614B2